LRNALALARYLQRHSEPELPRWTDGAPRWGQVVVIPAYRESPDLLQALTRVPAAAARTLVIVVLNRPDSDADPTANGPLRSAIAASSTVDSGRGIETVPLNPHTELYPRDLEARRGPLPAARGVGLARKAGCDFALSGIAAGAIAGQWICSTDADAELPPDYFAPLPALPGAATAAVFPFRHVPADDPALTEATLLYELRLHHYLLGLDYAGSPYAFQTLGSCLAVRATAYAHVRGFPRRSGGEDFHLLDKLAKLGDVVRLRGGCVRLRSRSSRRVPFGTGPSVTAIRAAPAPRDLPLFYHPAVFEALRALLSALPSLHSPGAALEPALVAHGLPAALADSAAATLRAQGVEQALAHCRRQGRCAGQFQRHFHQWFGALRTLRFCHGVRDRGWPPQSLAALEQCAPRLWPCAESPGAGALRDAIAAHWGWRG